VAALPGRTGDDRLTGEQAALRRVATLVARGVPAEEVLSTVAEEAGRLLHSDHATMGRYDPEGAMTVVAAWSSTGTGLSIGTQHPLGGQDDLATMVFKTGRPARADVPGDSSGPLADAAREIGLRAGVAVPVIVEGELWGLMAVESRVEPLPAGTEARLARFTELAAIAIANAQARMELRGFADEQAALRRVATLVARGAPPGEVLAAVTEEAGRLLHADHATMLRYGPGATTRVVASWGMAGVGFPVGAEEKRGGQNLHTMVFQTGRPARTDDHVGLSGGFVEIARELGMRAAVAVPVSVEGRLWGVMSAASREGPLPADTETRLARFTELGATAIANAEAQSALTTSRARIVAACDATRRRMERNLHDGAQQRLVSLALNLRAARASAPPGADKHVHQLDEVAAGLDDLLEDLREIGHGLHPAILAKGGLRPALKTLARRFAIPVDLDIRVDRRLPDQVEIAAYYTVSEALTNAAKHARATAVDIQVAESDGVLYARVRDNGRGGADASRGSGLIGLNDRAEALGGHLRIDSPPTAGTTLEMTLPLDDPMHESA
jgi:signal transduction histidine kinase